jgi:hypothetical protein
MRLVGIDSIAAANHFLETRFLPEWEQRFTVQPRNPRNAHRRLDREHRLEEILSVRAARKVAPDHTVSWDGVRWGVLRRMSAPDCGVQRWKSRDGWMARTGCVSGNAICACGTARNRHLFSQILLAYGLPDLRNEKPSKEFKPKYHVPPEHPWRKPWRRTFLSSEKEDISTLR